MYCDKIPGCLKLRHSRQVSLSSNLHALESKVMYGLGQWTLGQYSNSCVIATDRHYVQQDMFYRKSNQNQSLFYLSHFDGNIHKYKADKYVESHIAIHIEPVFSIQDDPFLWVHSSGCHKNYIFVAFFCHMMNDERWMGTHVHLQYIWMFRHVMG